MILLADDSAPKNNDFLHLAYRAAAGDRDEVVNEAADLVYHLLVLLSAREIAFADVVDALESRHANV